MKKLTKIVATIGPASESEERIAELLKLGVNIFRFNLKHNELSWHGQTIEKVRKIAEELDIPVGILIDMQGPEIRIQVPGDDFQLEIGDHVALTKTLREPGLSSSEQAQKSFVISHPDIIQYLKRDQEIIVDDGKFHFTIEQEGKNSVILISHSKGMFKNRKSMNIPGVYFPLPVITERDRAAIDMGKKYEVDFVALSFVRQAQDIEELRAEMDRQKLVAKVVSKIETKMAIDNLDEIIAASDALMVARGDLGIELPAEQVPYYQKIMIRKCIERGIPVITATQMLESMIENPYATRAEISDVANACYDFTDATMLSGETAFGKYPERVVATMARTLEFTEKKVDLDMRANFTYHIADHEETICDAAYNLARMIAEHHEGVGGFIVFTSSGRTARKLSRYRAKLPIYAFTPDAKAYGSLILSYGVMPILHPEIFSKNHQVENQDIQEAFRLLGKMPAFDSKKHYIVLHGDVWMSKGATSTIKLVTYSSI